MIRKLLTVFSLTLFMFVGFVIPAFAKDNDAAKLDKILAKRGYPAEVLAILEDEQKQSLVDSNSTFVSFKRMDVPFYEKGQNVPSRDVNAQTLSNFTQSLLVSNQPSSGGKLYSRVDYNWDWNQDLLWELEDKFGIAWSSGWDAMPSTAQTSYRVFNAAGNSQVSSRYGYEAYTPGAGIGWHVDILDGFYDNGNYTDAVRHKGWGAVTLTRGSDNSGTTQSSSASATYFHKQAQFNASLTFVGGAIPEVNLDSSYGWDQSTDVGYQWYWTNVRY